MNKILSLTGRWEAFTLEGRTTSGWQIAQKFNRSEFIWEFYSCGILNEFVTDMPILKTIYSFYSKDKLLHIDRTNCLLRCTNLIQFQTDSYYIEPLNNNEIFAYIIIDLQHGLTEIWYRIRFKYMH